MPDVDAELRWEGGTVLSARAGRTASMLDWGSGASPSPVQALVLALAGCMASDVVLILEKGRLPIEGLALRVAAFRAPQPPRRLLRVDIAFTVTGDVPPEKVDRAIRLSRETYCSVWHSMAQDIELTTSFEVAPSPRA
jgi:putative redox protein